MSEPHSQELLDMCRAHFNEPIIASFDLMRCIGYGETGVDCYVIAKGRGGKVVWLTCVGGYTFLDRLKGQERGGVWDDFTRLDSLLGYNGAPKEDEFRLDLRHDDMEDQRSLNDCLNEALARS